METYLLFTICSRKKLKMFLDFYKEYGLVIGTINYGRGTAAYNVLDYLGLEDDEKTMHCTVVSENTWKKLKKGLEKELYIDNPGTGICYLVPLNSVGGKKVLSFLLNGQEYTREKEKTMRESKHELIVTVANYGFNNEIIAAAKKAGARGGTVLHGKGMGNKEAQQFMGMSLVSEKEIILIVCNTKEKNDIMSSIMSTKAEAGIVCFSLPVDDVAGFKLHEVE